MPTIRVTDETWRRLQAAATPFRGSERGTPDKVISWLLDEHEGTQISDEDLAARKAAFARGLAHAGDTEDWQPFLTACADALAAGVSEDTLVAWAEEAGRE